MLRSLTLPVLYRLTVFEKLKRDAFVATAQNERDVFGQRDRFDGLRQVALESGGEGDFFVLGRRKGRQCDGWHVGAVFLRQVADLFDQGVTVLFGHSDVGDQNVGQPLVENRQGLGGRSGGANFGAVARKHHTQDFSRVVFVIDDQDPDAAERTRTLIACGAGGGAPRRARSVAVLNRQRQRDHEVATLRFAATVGVYRAAMQLDDVFDYGQSQSESALAPPGRVVHLREPVEDVRQVFG